MAIKRGRPKKAEIALSEQEHARLQVMAHSRLLPHSVVRRAQMILMSVKGHANTAIGGAFWLDAAQRWLLEKALSESKDRRVRGHLPSRATTRL